MATNSPPTVSHGDSSSSSSNKRAGVSFFESMNPLELLRASKTLTPREFLRDFYTQRGLLDKLKDVDALVATYGHQMHTLYAELDKKYVSAEHLPKTVGALSSVFLLSMCCRYGTSFAAHPPPVTEEVRASEPVAAVVTTPKAGAKPPVNKSTQLSISMFWNVI